MEKSDKFDECMLNCQNFSYQNFALRKFQYSIFYGYNLLRNLSLSGFVTLCLVAHRKLKLMPTEHLLDPALNMRVLCGIPIQFMTSTCWNQSKIELHVGLEVIGIHLLSSGQNLLQFALKNLTGPHLKYVGNTYHEPR